MGIWTRLISVPCDQDVDVLGITLWSTRSRVPSVKGSFLTLNQDDGTFSTAGTRSKAYPSSTLTRRTFQPFLGLYDPIQGDG